MAGSRLIGRESELARLADWVDEVASGRGRAVLIEGEPGIGKSALLRAAADQAAQSGSAVFCGAGDELGQAFPLLPLLDAFAVQESSIDPRRAEVLHALAGKGADPAVAAAAALLALIDLQCAESPAVLVIDDLHWADVATVSVCDRLARSSAQRSLLLIGAMRPLPRRGDLKTLWRAVGRDNLISLAPLAPGAVTELVADLTGAQPGPGLARLAADAAGNPLYITELVAALDRGGDLTVADGNAEVAGGPTPATLSEAITDRLDFLPAHARQALQAAALLGTEFTVDDLAVVLGRPVSELASALADARAAGVLAEAGERGSMAFRHPLIRTALYNDLPVAVRIAWHRDAARALDDAGASVERVARQLLPTIAVPGHETALAGWAIDWLVGASPALLRQVPPVAVELLESAAAHLPAGDVRRVRLTTRLAEGLLRLGRADEAAQLVQRTLPEADDAELFIALHMTLSQCRSYSGQEDIGLVELERALARPDLTSRQRALLRVRAARQHSYLGQSDAAERAARDALDWVDNAEDREITCNALFTMVARRAWIGDERGALELATRALAQVDGNPEFVELNQYTQMQVGVQLTVLDRCEEAEAILRRAERLADRAGSQARLEQAHAWLACLFFETGRWDDALTEISFTGSALWPQMRSQIEGAAAFISLHRGDAKAARRHLSAADAQANRRDEAVVAYQRLARALDHEHSGALTDALAVLLVDDGDLQEIEVLLPDAVRLAVAVGDRTAAREVAARAEALPSQADVPHRAAIAVHCRGLLDADPELLLRAADRYADARRPLPRAQALEAAAALLADRGDTAAARAPFTTALEAYNALGADWDITQARARFRTFGMLPRIRRPHRPTSGWEALTDTEMKVAELATAGRSNPEIADMLLLSRYTVATHVARVLAKLQVRSRIDLAHAAAQRAVGAAP